MGSRNTVFRHLLMVLNPLPAWGTSSIKSFYPPLKYFKCAALSPTPLKPMCFLIVSVIKYTRLRPINMIKNMYHLMLSILIEYDIWCRTFVVVSSCQFCKYVTPLFHS